ncbi:unnamed protein product [Urochloa decumbens]|uniref:Uncharacterized protein n=1 Tax=Urochloa decumbens TaxID=240449 RepID=A0ABC8ZFY2_9POAL
MGEEEEGVQEAEDARGERKRKRGLGGGGEEEVGAAAEAKGGGAAGDGGVYEKELLEEDFLRGGGGVYEKELLGEEDDDDGAGYEGIAEEAVAEVMKWLEAEISSPAAAPASSPGFVTINGNEESCGPSFSAPASTVMASVDTRAGFPPPSPLPWPWPWPEPLQLPILPAAGRADDMDVDAAAAKTNMDADDVEMDLGADEEWLARLLTCGGPLLEGVL